MGFPIRISSDQSLFAAPRSFSQRTTSFIASQCQGIHQMPLRRLIALIINTHRALKPKDKPACAAALPMNMIRKTILLQHPSGSQALQDLSFPPAKWAPSIRTAPKIALATVPNQIRPGICEPAPAGRSQPDECLLTMSNNAFDRRRLMPGHQSRKTYLSSDKYSTPLP